MNAPRSPSPRLIAYALASLVLLAPALARAEPPFAEPPPGAEPPPDLPTPAKVAAPSAPAPSYTPPQESESSRVDLIRVDIGGMYTRGTKLLGYGTRAPYQGVAATAHLGGAYFPIPWLGFDIHMHGLAASTRVTAISFGMDATLDAAIQWRGALPGAFVLGAGGGFEAGNKGWVDEDVRGFPMALARLRLVPARRRMVQLDYRLVPVTASKLEMQMHHVEIAGAVSFLHFGARVDLSQAKGGDPVRIYRENAFGVFIGAGWF